MSEFPRPAHGSRLYRLEALDDGSPPMFRLAQQQSGFRVYAAAAQPFQQRRTTPAAVGCADQERGVYRRQSPPEAPQEPRVKARH